MVKGKKTKLMLRVERANGGRPLERFLPAMINEQGLSATAEELKVCKATLGYWILNLGIERHWVVLVPGEILIINRPQ